MNTNACIEVISVKLLHCFKEER